MLAFAALLAVYPIVAHATLSVLQPTGAGWIGNTTVTVAWAWNATDPTFSVELANPTINFGLLAQGPIAVANNVVPNTNQVSFDLPVLPPGSNYEIRLVNIFDVTQIYAKSPAFPISANPTSSSVTGSNTAAVSGSQTSVSASTTKGSSSTKSGSASSGAATPTGSGSSTESRTSLAATSGAPTSTESRTTLAITPLSSTGTSASVAPSTSTRSGAATRLSTGWVSAAGAMLVGAIVAI